jgi:hypothetical protein
MTSCVKPVVALILVALLAGPTAGEGVKSSATTKRSKVAILKKKEAPTRPMRASGPAMRHFVDKEGVLVLTNRPEKYERKKGYAEVSIRYNPITVPNRYRKLRSLNQYNVGTIAHLVENYASMYGLDKNLVYAVIKAESNFNPAAVSRAGARGLMQLMPGTAMEMGVNNIFDPAQNIAGGTQYLAKMLELFNDDMKLALAAYNSGPSTVKAAGAIPAIPETREYVRRVCAYYSQFSSNSIRPNYVTVAQAPDASFLPQQHAKAEELKKEEEAAKPKVYTLRFHSGLTQPADKIEDQDPYYCVTYSERTTLIRKDFVKEIISPV